MPPSPKVGSRSGLSSVEAQLIAHAHEVAGLRDDMTEVKKSIGSIADHLGKLTAIEAEHGTTREAIARAFSEITAGNQGWRDECKRVADKQDSFAARVHSIEVAVPARLTDRLTEVEVAMPGLREGRKWQLQMYGIVLTMMLAAVIGLVFIGRTTLVQFSPPVVVPSAPPSPLTIKPGYEFPVWRTTKGEG